MHDAAYVRAVFAGAGTASVLALLEEMVRGGDRSDVSAALLFTQDGIVFGLAPRDFWIAYQGSGLLAAIREGLYAGDYSARHEAIYAVGRIGPRENAGYLASALPWSLANDPLNLDGLLRNLSVLDRRTRLRTHLEAMVRAPWFATRWAALNVLWEWAGTRKLLGHAWARQLLRQLAQDANPWVRLEAGYRLDELRSARRRKRLPRWHRAAFVERLRSGEPTPTFFQVWLHVSNYLSLAGEADYDDALLKEIGQHLLSYPMGQPFDIHAYWQPLVAARGIQLAG
jgi:hypothetical protein